MARGQQRGRGFPHPSRSAVVTTIALAALAVLPLRATALSEVLGVSPQPPGYSYPPMPADAQPRRVLPLVITAAAPKDSFKFESVKADGQPLTFDPCRPVHYVTNPAGMPRGGDKALRKAISSIAARTGLQFVDDGTTDEVPSHRRRAIDQARYGNRWAPILIAWSSADSDNLLSGDVAGYGGGQSVAPSGPGSERLVTGEVVIDDEAFVHDSPASRPTMMRIVLMHELAHVVGLDHVDDRGQLMYPTTTNKTDWGRGDIAGLALLGQGVCHTDT